MQKYTNKGYTNKDHFKTILESTSKLGLLAWFHVLAVASLIIFWGVVLFLYLASDLVFLVSRYHGRCLDRILQPSAVSLHLPSSHPLDLIALDSVGKKKMTSVVFILFSRKEIWLEEERMGLSSVIPRISLGKTG